MRRIMKRKQIFSLFFVFIFACLLYSCAEGGNDLKIQTSLSSKSLHDLSSKIYEKEELSKIAVFNGSIEQLNKEYPIECIRNNNGAYRVVYLGEEDIAVLLFDSDGNKYRGSIYTVRLTKNDFEHLTEGLTLEDVRKVDPDGEYLFLYTGRNDTPRLSSHYTKDGFLITIEYDSLNNIINKYEELI